MKYVELNNFLVAKGFASTGGQAKILIRSGTVLVNQQIEIQVKKKLYPGYLVDVKGEGIVVQEDVCLKED